MDPRLSIFLNSFVMMIMGPTVVVLIMDSLFPRRNSIVVFWVYMLFRGATWALYDIPYVMGTLGTLEHDFQLIATPLYGVITYVVLYYTWDTSFAKIGIGALVGDVLASVATVCVLFVVHKIFGTPSPTDYRGYLGVPTLIRGVGPLVISVFTLRVLKPILQWFSAYEFVHPKLWNVLTVMAVAIPTVARMFSMDQIRESVAIESAMFAIAMMCLAGFIAKRITQERKRKELLASEGEFARHYDQAILEQLSYLEESSAKLDAVALEAAAAEAATTNATLAQQVSDLRKLCDELRHGMYSDCPALDVALLMGEQELSKKGMTAEYRIAPLGDAAVQAAMLSQTMLMWAIDSYGANGTDAERGHDVALRIGRVANQLFFVFTLPSDKHKKFPERLLKERMVTFDGIVQEDDDGVRKTIRALVCIE